MAGRTDLFIVGNRRGQRVYLVGAPFLASSWSPEPGKMCWPLDSAGEARVWLGMAQRALGLGSDVAGVELIEVTRPEPRNG